MDINMATKLSLFVTWRTVNVCADHLILWERVLRRVLRLMIGPIAVMGLNVTTCVNEA